MDYKLFPLSSDAESRINASAPSGVHLDERRSPAMSEDHFAARIEQLCTTAFQ